MDIITMKIFPHADSIALGLSSTIKEIESSMDSMVLSLEDGDPQLKSCGRGRMLGLLYLL